MAAPMKGTVMPLGAVFLPEETQRAVARVAEAIANRQAELSRLQGFVADNAALVSLVKRLPDEVSHEIMEGLVEIREEYDEHMESNVAKSEASISAGGMPDKDREHARIMARLDELELEEQEAGRTTDNDEDEDEGAGTSEDGKGNEEYGDALSDKKEPLSSGFDASRDYNLVHQW